MTTKDILITVAIVWSLGLVVVSQIDRDYECQQRLHKQADIIRYERGRV